MFLSELGHELVGRCESGQRAIEMCHELKPDVILMDIHLQGDLDGIQTAEILKTQLDLPVIYISGDTTNSIIERAILTNSYGYLVKPVNKKELGISIDLAYYKHQVDVEQRKRERGYREFFSDSPVPIVIIRNGRIQYLNKLALDMVKTHYIEDVIGLNFERFIDDRYKQKVSALLAGEGLDNNRFIDEHVILRDLHGVSFHAEISGSIIRFNDDLAMQILIRDVSTRIFQSQMAGFYKKVLTDLSIPIVTFDKEFRLTSSNAAAEAELPGLEAASTNEPVKFVKDAVLKCSGVKQPDDLARGVSVELTNANGETSQWKCYVICADNGNRCEWLLTRGEC
jgi:PAS domain S-box-containing protein